MPVHQGDCIFKEVLPKALLFFCPLGDATQQLDNHIGIVAKTSE